MAETHKLLAAPANSWLIYRVVRTPLEPLFRPGCRACRWFSFALVFLVLGCGLISSSTTLHRFIHHDADNAHHECAICLFAHGQIVLADSNPPLLSAVWSEFQRPLPLVTSDQGRNESLLPLGRAPPLSPS